MILPSFLDNCYQRVKHNFCSPCLDFYPRVITRLFLAITSIMQSVCSVLRWIYFYTQKQQKVRELNNYYHKYENELKNAFFRLGAMNVSIDTKDINFLVDMQNINALFQGMDEDSTASELFENSDRKCHTLEACETYFDELHEKYLAGKSLFQRIQDAVKACAQKQDIGTTEVVTSLSLPILLIETGVLSPQDTKKIIFWRFLYVITEKYVTDFQTLFQENLPKDH